MKKSDGCYMPVKTDAVQSLIASLIEAIGIDSQSEGLRDTPRRVSEAYVELTSGYEMNPKKILEVEFNEVTGMIVAKGIDFFSLCEHHLLPFYGKVHIAYIPRNKVVGLSKLVRLVDCFSRRLQVQERITKQIADSMDENLKPVGVAVVIEAIHMCMRMRGVRNGSEIVTSEIRGAFKNIETKQEFFNILYGKQNGQSI
jgi:GTP cyclohydrolase I